MPYDMSLSRKWCWCHLCDFDIKTVNVSTVPMFFKIFRNDWFIIAVVRRLFMCRSNLYLKIDVSIRDVGTRNSVY